MSDPTKEKTTGVVIEALPDARFRVQLDDNTVLLAYLAGKMRLRHIKVLVGDRVAIEATADKTKGRIVYRN